MSRELGIVTASGVAGRLGGNRVNFKRVWRATRDAQAELVVCNIEPSGKIVTYSVDAQTRAFRATQGRDVPRVLYNRIPTRLLESRKNTIAQLASLASAGHVVTNPHFLAKDTLADWWGSDPLLRPYLPPTRRVHFLQDIVEFIDAHRAFYLKPCAGKAGVGIVSVRLEGSAYVWQEQQAGTLRRPERGTKDQLVRVLWVKCRHKPHILQREARLATYHGRKFDVRLLLHPNPQESFEITGAGVRMGDRGAITTHVPNGGSIVPLDDVLHALYDQRSPSIKEELSRVAITAAECVARQPGVWCELSMDVGLGPDGHPWIFEANAKPMKFDEQKIERLAKERLVRYLLALSESTGT